MSSNKEESVVMETMKGKFIMSGLSKPASVTCLHKNEIFWATSGIPQDRFNALFDYFKKGPDDVWKDQKFAVLEYEKADEDGTPIDARMIEVIL